ncbi:hypothetical protein Tco_1173657 [Tanacetum coccineum]
MDDPNITMEEYIQLMADKARGRDQTFNWETATNDEVYCDDLDSFTDFETYFPAIVYNDASTSYQNVTSEPKLSAYTTYSLNEYSVYMYQYGVSWGPSERNDNVGGVFINLEISKC